MSEIPKTIPCFDCRRDTCDFFGIGGPCYGQISVHDEINVGDDYEWVHACEAHDECVAGQSAESNEKKYKPWTA